MIQRSLFQALLGAVSLACTLPSGAVNAQGYPSRPITLIVPYPAGTATDMTLRALASATEKHLGQSIVVENKPGAAGTLAPAQVAAAGQPDGYIITQIPLVVFRAPFLRKTNYDPAKDFTYLIGVTGYVYGLVVRSDSPWKTLQELLADARANPGKISYGTPGANTTQHITMMQIAKQHGIDWVHVPFKGGPESINALLGGHINASADTTAWGPQVNSGQFRLLATFGASRTKSWPTAPTLREAGINMAVTSPYGLAGPRGMDPGIVKVLHDAFKKGTEEPSFRATMDKLDQEIWYLNSDHYREYALREIAEQKRIVEEFGLKPD